MTEPRVIPMLTLIGEGLYRTVAFRKPVYVGDPINAVKLFNDKEVDELMVADVSPERAGDRIQYGLLEDIATEAFMPMAYAGKITSLEQVDRLLRLGYEKVVLNTATVTNFDLIAEISSRFGAQSCVVSIDVGKPLFGKPQVMIDCGRRKTGLDAIEHLQRCQEAGAGELLLRSISKDGTMAGYDIELIAMAAAVVEIPLVAVGGAGTLEHLAAALRSGAHSVAAGSMFVFQGKHRGVLINYPQRAQISALLQMKPE